MRTEGITMPGTDRRLAPTRLLDGSWRWHDGPRILVGAPDGLDEASLEDLLFADAPTREDWQRVRATAASGA